MSDNKLESLLAQLNAAVAQLPEKDQKLVAKQVQGRTFLARRAATKEKRGVEIDTWDKNKDGKVLIPMVRIFHGRGKPTYMSCENALTLVSMANEIRTACENAIKPATVTTVVEDKKQTA